MMAEDEYQFLIGQTLVCLHLVLSADPHKVHEKGGEISVIDDCVLSCLIPVSVTATMSRFFRYESGFRPPLCTYRLDWARRTSWGWWNDWDVTVLQTQDSKFEPWRSEAEHATSRSRRLPTILTFTRGWGRNIFVSFKPPRPGTEPRTLAWKAAVLTTALGPPPFFSMLHIQRRGLFSVW